MSATAAAQRWLVTGSSGQVGSACLALAREHGVTAIAYPGKAIDIDGADQVRRVLAAERPDVVLNTAALTAVDLCETDTARAKKLNAVVPDHLAQACRGGPLLVQLSTDYVFNGRACRPIAEDEPTEPLSEYGRTKLAGEEAVRAAGANHLIVRTQWVFGSGSNFVRTILGAAKKGAPLRVVEDQLGHPTWAESLARGLFAAVRQGARGTLHLANEGIASFYDFAFAIVAEGARIGACPRVRVVPIPTSQMPRPAERPQYGVLGLGRARSLGIELPHWTEVLPPYLQWLRGQNA